MKLVACSLAILFGYIGHTQSSFETAKEKSKAILTEITNRADVVGTSISIGYQDSIIYSKGYGYADRENEVQVQPYHKFRIYSLSKHIAAIAAAKLNEKRSSGLRCSHRSLYAPHS